MWSLHFTFADIEVCSYSLRPRVKAEGTLWSGWMEMPGWSLTFSVGDLSVGN